MLGCECAKNSVSLGFCIARADKKWTCDGCAISCSKAQGSAVRVFLGVGVIGVRSAVALRALVASTGGPPRSVRLFEARHLLGFVFVQVPELGILFGVQLGIQSCTTLLRRDN